MKEWKFNIGDAVTITESAEAGGVIGRAEYGHSDDCYLVRYKAGDGRAVEDWWTETALS